MTLSLPPVARRIRSCGCHDTEYAGPVWPRDENSARSPCRISHIWSSPSSVTAAIWGMSEDTKRPACVRAPGFTATCRIALRVGYTFTQLPISNPRSAYRIPWVTTQIPLSNSVVLRAREDNISLPGMKPDGVRNALMSREDLRITRIAQARPQSARW